jgi:hypothetical protein
MMNKINVRRFVLSVRLMLQLPTKEQALIRIAEDRIAIWHWIQHQKRTSTRNEQSGNDHMISNFDRQEDQG